MIFGLKNLFKGGNQNTSKRVYLDYCSITPTDPRVLEVVAKYYGTMYGNPSSLHLEGVNAKNALIDARTSIARVLNAYANEVIFTGNGTEANNLAITGYIEVLRQQASHGSPAREYSSMHIVASMIEHSSVLEPLKALERKGVKVTLVASDAQGIISAENVAHAMNDQTVLVSIMMVNNEIGTIQPIRDIAKAIRRRAREGQQIAFHTDACQTFLYEDIDLQNLGVQMLTLDAHKVYGPKGIGMLYIKRGIELKPVILGGGQEHGMRSGTEAVPHIAGFAKALEIAFAERASERNRLTKIKDECIEQIKSIRPDAVFNGGDPASPHVLNVTFPENPKYPHVEHEFLMFKLDARGISVSTKSSCIRDEDDSYVLKAINAPSGQSIRISFGRYTTPSEMKRFYSALRESIL